MLKNKKIIENLDVKQKLSLLAGQLYDGLPFFDVINLETNDKITNSLNSYPSFNSLANSFDTNLIENVAAKLTNQAKSDNLNVVITPNVGVKLNPYGAGMSEDPYYSGTLASAYKTAVINSGAMPILSGCSIDDCDTLYLDKDVNKNIIRDYVTRPYEIALKNSQLGAVKTSDCQPKGNYRDVNLNVINDILKDKKYFSVNSFCEITNADNAVKCLNTGNSLVLNGDVKLLETAYDNYLDLKKSLDSGAITVQEYEDALKGGNVLSDDVLDNAVDKFLDFAFQSEECAASQSKTEQDNSVDTLSFQASAQSIVLLKNEANVLPLKQYDRVAVIGQIAALENCRGESFINTLLAKKELAFDYVGFSNGYDLLKQRSDDYIAEACVLAASCDTVILFLGFSQSRDTLKCKLPTNQLALIDSLSKTGKKIVAVLPSDFSIDTSFDDDCHATIIMPTVGAFNNDALLKIISGEINPSGKLAYTLYDNTEEFFGDIKNRKDSSRIKIGAFFGYRYYDTAEINVKYPFGHGLSYTDFLYTRIKADSYSVQFFVKNIGNVGGYETVQLYLGKSVSNVARPKKELIGYRRIYLEAGQSTQIDIDIDYNDFAFCDSDGARKVENGEYTVFVGASVADIRLEKSFWVTGVEFEEKKDDLSSYIPSVSNIVSGRYTLQTDKTKRKKTSKSVLIYTAMLLIAGIYDIIFALAGGSYNFVSMLLLIMFNLAVPVAIIGLVIDGKKTKNQNTITQQINNQERENEAILENETSLEKLFLDEFTEDETIEEVLPQNENLPICADEEFSLKSLADNLILFMNERGISLDVLSARSCFSGIYCSRTIYFKNADLTLLTDFISKLNQYFGMSEDTENSSAADNKIPVQFLVFCEDNLTELADTAAVIDVKMRKVKSKDEPTVVALAKYNQIIRLCEKAEKSCVISEGLFKKIDKLEAFVNSLVPYAIGNKQWRKIEKFISVFLACGGVESEAADGVLTAKLLPKILPIIKQNKQSSEFSVAFKKIFGEESCLRV